MGVLAGKKHKMARNVYRHVQQVLPPATHTDATAVPVCTVAIKCGKQQQCHRDCTLALYGIWAQSCKLHMQTFTDITVTCPDVYVEGNEVDISATAMVALFCSHSTQHPCSPAYNWMLCSKTGQLSTSQRYPLALSPPKHQGR